MTSILKVDTLQDSGGNAILSSNGTGTITTSSALNTAITNAGFVTSANAGKVLQVVTATDQTTRSTTSTSFTDITGLSVSITPSSTSSKVLIICHTNGYSGNTAAASEYTLVRDSTNLATNFFGKIYGANDLEVIISMTILDSPSTTSATTYKAQFRRSSASGTAGANYMNSLGSITAMEISA